MNKVYLKGILLALFVLVSTVLLIYWSQNYSETKPYSETNTNTKLMVGDVTLNVETADSAIEIVQGLSGREYLEGSSGMYFILGERKFVQFWMKNMKFSIDIIWIDEGRVVGFVENAPLPTQGIIPTFTSPTPVTHVLEVNAGFVQKHTLEKGQKVEEIK